MDDYVEALVSRGKNEVAVEEVICCLVDLILMFARRVAMAKPRLADRVRQVQNVQLVCNIGGIDYRAHPGTPCHGVRRKIEHDGKIMAQYVHHVRPHRFAKPHGKAREILDCPVFGWVRTDIQSSIAISKVAGRALRSSGSAAMHSAPPFL